MSASRILCAGFFAGAFALGVASDPLASRLLERTPPSAPVGVAKAAVSRSCVPPAPRHDSASSRLPAAGLHPACLTRSRAGVSQSGACTCA